MTLDLTRAPGRQRASQNLERASRVLAPSFTNVVLVFYPERLRNGRKSQRIQDDYDECLRYQLHGTPTFDLNLCVLRIPFAARQMVSSLQQSGRPAPG